MCEEQTAEAEQADHDAAEGKEDGEGEAGEDTVGDEDGLGAAGRTTGECAIVAEVCGAAAAIARLVLLRLSATVVSEWIAGGYVGAETGSDPRWWTSGACARCCRAPGCCSARRATPTSTATTTASSGATCAARGGERVCRAAAFCRVEIELGIALVAVLLEADADVVAVDCASRFGGPYPGARAGGVVGK